jgi:hypothetical protein
MMERRVVGACSGFMAVSQTYLADLEKRYGDGATNKPMLVRPFPAEPGELDAFRNNAGLGTPDKAHMVWRYIGRGGADMAKAASAFFQAWKRALDEGKLAPDLVRFEAYGTSYAAEGKGDRTFAPLVAKTELAASVLEDPARLGYSGMLRKLMDSDALIVFGSDDPAYTASKIYPYMLAGKPLLAIFHEKSSVVQLMYEVGGGVCVTFNEHTTQAELSAAIGEAWFAQNQHRNPIHLDHVNFAPYTARSQAREVSTWFGKILAPVAYTKNLE